MSLHLGVSVPVPLLSFWVPGVFLCERPSATYLFFRSFFPKNQQAMLVIRVSFVYYSTFPMWYRLPSRKNSFPQYHYPLSTLHSISLKRPNNELLSCRAQQLQSQSSSTTCSIFCGAHERYSRPRFMVFHWPGSAILHWKAQLHAKYR